MLNAERFRNEILEAMNSKNELSLQETNGFLLNKYSNEFKPCSEDEYSDCDNCLFDDEDLTHSCEYHRTKWLLSECKEPIKLTRFERDILKYLSDNTKYMYIVRDGNGNIFLYDEEPQKSESAPWWTGHGMCHTSMFNKLFHFVQWEDTEPRSIKEVLENCEVVEDESNE